ncbi:hypothetical protein HED55_16510 [Ochrobactrum haematophilum]|uniref:Uncharacterized protein n=1 Tax=Brucella haematophila TaxID=419474 RepID=A0ABX1DMR8_9HYPH|nr:hypothetical protein [Brucella haematophila]
MFPLVAYEDAASGMEQQLGLQPMSVRQRNSGSSILSFPPQPTKRPKLVVIQGDGGDVA